MVEKKHVISKSLKSVGKHRDYNQPEGTTKYQNYFEYRGELWTKRGKFASKSEAERSTRDGDIVIPSSSGEGYLVLAIVRRISK